MRRITFFIGNGFDINVGLDTEYSSFYNYYLKKNPKDMLAQEMSASYKFWADLEEGLGHYTAKVPSDRIDQFFASEELMENSLADYLELQMNRIQISSGEEKEIAKKMKKSVLKFYEELPKSQEEYIKNVIYKIRDSIVYTFIVFNYTNSFDKCIELLKQEYPEEIQSHRADNGYVYQKSVGNIIHVNGTVNEEMILGVNDISQIDNQEIIQNPLFCEFLIKKETNKRFGQDKVKDVKDIIDSSEVICVFGMSIGITDKMWWEYIAKWLRAGHKRRLIIFEKQKREMKRITKQNLFSLEEEILNNFKNNSGIDDIIWKEIREKIFIKINSNLFDFKITK